MIAIWISGFCVGTGLAGLILALAPVCARPDLVASVGMLAGGACALGIARAIRAQTITTGQK